MANIGKIQKDYIEAYKVLRSKDINVSALLMLTEMSYEEKEKLVEYKSDLNLKSEEYSLKIDIYYRHLLSTFLKVNNANNIYDNFREIFDKVYLDNKDDDTNDYADETMIKLNKIYNFINCNSNNDFNGTELLSLLRKEVTNVVIDEPLQDKYFDVQFNELKKLSNVIRESDLDTKIALVPRLLEDIGDMESHLFRRKLFNDDYRKSVTGLSNYLLSRAELPEIYIKPIELDDYYECILKPSDINNTDLITFYKEKMCDSIEKVLIIPMKDSINNYNETELKKESGLLDNKILTLKQNKYK